MAKLLFLALTIGLADPVNAFEPRKITFTRLGDTLKLSGYVSLPGKSKPPHPAIIFLHGCSGIGFGGSLRATYRAWMSHFNDRGYAVLAIDSLTPRGFPTGCGRGERRKTLYRERPGDAYSGLAYLQARPDIRRDRIGLMGWSQGGGIGLLTVNSESIGRPNPPPGHDFRAAALLYPSACAPRWQTRPYTTVKRGTWSAVAPILVLHGAKDNWTRYEPCKVFIDSLRRRGEPAAFVLYPTAAHSFDAPNLKLRRRRGPILMDGTTPLIGTDPAARKDALKRVPEYFDRHLKP